MKKGEWRRHCDSLMAAGWHIDRSLEYDIRCVDAEFIIRNIELAFHVWRKPWASDVSFGDFCRYILPYRSQNEPLSYARERLMRRYIPALDSAGVRNAMEACRIINARLKEETDASGKGTCDALCGYSGCRTQTVWTRMNWGHVWCVAGGYRHVLATVKYLMPAKVYRRYYLILKY